MWKLAPLLAATACAQLLDLGDPRKDDRDHDGIPDSVDNCPDVANVDQSDKDGNGIGDACDGCISVGGADSDGDGIPDACDGCDNRQPDSNGDGIPDACQNGITDPCPDCVPCSVGPHHDEDGDKIADGCDLCPALAGSDNTDVDGDGVGAPCDPDPSSGTQEQVFDSFFLPNQAWYTVGPWTTASDQVTAGTGGALVTLAYRALGAGRGSFTIRTHVQPNISDLDDTNVSAYASPMQDPNAFGAIACSLAHAPGGMVNLQARDMNGITSSPPVTMEKGYTLTLTFSPGQLYCKVEPDSGGATSISVLLISMTNSTWITGIYSTGSGFASFDDYDVIGQQY